MREEGSGSDKHSTAGSIVFVVSLYTCMIDTKKRKGKSSMEEIVLPVHGFTLLFRLCDSETNPGRALFCPKALVCCSCWIHLVERADVCVIDTPTEG